MKIYNKLCISVSLCLGMMMGACTSDDGVGEEQPKGLMPVLFSAGNMEAAITRSASASYMPENSRFVCSMFFHAGANDSNDSQYAAPLSEVNMFSNELTIEGSLGNATYKDNKSFYWQNRLDHVFLAIADNHKPTEAPEVAVGGKLLCDLTRTDQMDLMKQQPDPIVAYVKMSPAGATPEANRVKLFFKHQFAQVQVNIKSSLDESASITANQITNVELIGVARNATIPFSIKPNGDMQELTVSEETQNFNMFVCSTPTSGYIKSFECIAFGTLKTIRVTWEEKDKDTEGNPYVHQVELKSVNNVELLGGHRYIYNIELRRTGIAQLSAEIVDWTDDTASYETKGTIKE